MALRKTLLEMTQEILEAMDSDTVSDIDDTEESATVADIIQNTYWEIVVSRGLPEHFDLFELTASGSNDEPSIMFLPDECIELKWIKYNQIETGDTDPLFIDVDWMEPNDFFDLMHAMNTDDSNIEAFTRTIGGNTIDFKTFNDRFPKYYTTFDDETLIFDAYNSAEDTTLVSEKTQAWGLLTPSFTRANAAVPTLNSNLFPLLFNEAKATAFAELKQFQHRRAEGIARQQKIHSQKSNLRAHKKSTYTNSTPNYGRK